MPQGVQRIHTHSFESRGSNGDSFSKSEIPWEDHDLPHKKPSRPKRNSPELDSRWDFQAHLPTDLVFCSWDKMGPDTVWALIPRGHLLLQWAPVASPIFFLPRSTEHMPGFSSTSERQIKPHWEPEKLEAKEGLLCPPWEGPLSWGLKARAKRRLQRAVGSGIIRLDNVQTMVLSEESGQRAAHKGLLTTCR